MYNKIVQEENPIIKPVSAKKSPVLNIILGILLLLSLGSTIFLAYQNMQLKKELAKMIVASPVPTTTADMTANWKGYTNSLYGFSFKYPVDWILSSSANYISIGDPHYGVPGCKGDCPGFYIPILIDNNTKNLDLNTFIKNSFNSTTGGIGDFSKLKLEDFTSSAGISFTKVTGFPGTNYYALFTIHNGKIYQIQVGAGVNGMTDDINSPAVKQDLEIFNQILSTFKFITLTSQTDIKEWKSYTLGSTGLTVRLPPQIEFKNLTSAGATGTKYGVYSNGLTPSNDPLMISSDSSDYSAGRSGIFTDIQGYFIKNGNYYVNWALSQNKAPIQVPGDLSPKEIINLDGIHILKLKNSDTNNPYRSDGFLYMPTDLGAIINTNSKTYPGVAFQVDSTSLDEKTFDQILSTFKFTQ